MSGGGRDIELLDRGVMLRGRGGERYFNYFWLRDNCSSSFDPALRERVFDITALTRPPRAKAAALIGDQLEISWGGEDHVTRYSIAFLESFARRRCRAGSGAPAKRIGSNVFRKRTRSPRTRPARRSPRP